MVYRLRLRPFYQFIGKILSASGANYQELVRSKAKLFKVQRFFCNQVLKFVTQTVQSQQVEIQYLRPFGKVGENDQALFGCAADVAQNVRVPSIHDLNMSVGQGWLCFADLDELQQLLENAVFY